MTMRPYSILGLAHPRSNWLRDVSTWTNSGALSATLTKCFSEGEARQHLQALRPWSALIIDDHMALRCETLINEAASLSLPTFIVTDDSNDALRSTATLSASFTRDDLVAALATHALPSLEPEPQEIAKVISAGTKWQGSLIAVTGPGNTGASTVATAFAQHLGKKAVDPGSVALIDFARNAQQDVLHNVFNSRASVEDLIDANRMRVADSEDVRALLVSCDTRAFSLLCGVRKSSAWTTFGQGSIVRSLDALRQSYLQTVVDITCDVESRNETGSSDLELRNSLSIETARRADLVVVVGLPGVKGLHSVWQSVTTLLGVGVDSQRIVIVINRSPKNALARRGIASTLRSFIAASSPLCDIACIGEYNIEPSLLDGTELPNKLTAEVAKSLEQALSSVHAVHADEVATPIAPGTLGDFETGVGA